MVTGLPWGPADRFGVPEPPARRRSAEEARPGLGMEPELLVPCSAPPNSHLWHHPAPLPTTYRSCPCILCSKKRNKRGEWKGKDCRNDKFLTGSTMTAGRCGTSLPQKQTKPKPGAQKPKP